MPIKKPHLLVVIGWWLPIIGSICFALWTVYLEASASFLKAQEPFLSTQIELYKDTLKTVGVLVTSPRDATEWKTSEMRFWELYWAELSMVESGDVEAGMVRFAGQLNIFHKGGDNLRILETCSYELAHAVRRSIQERWRLTRAEPIPSTCPAPASPPSRLDGLADK